MKKEELPEPRSPLPKLKEHQFQSADWQATTQLYNETVLLRQDLNKVLNYLKSPES